MSKINLTDLSTITGNETSAINTINNNSTLIETFSDNTLSRDGTTPNTMLADFDMNSNRILNCVNAINDQEPATYGQVIDLIETITGVSINPAPGDATYLTLSTNATLTNERVLTAGTNISLVDGGAGSTLTINGTTSAPTTASYLTLGTDATLTNERVLTAGTGITLTDAGAGSTLTASVNQIALKPVESFVIAGSDEITALTVGVNKVKFRMPYAFTVTAVRASLSTAQASGTIFTVDINENGTTILSTKLTIDNTETTSTTAAIPPVISDSSLADDAEMSIDIDQIGNGSAKGLKVVLIGTRT